MRRALPRIALWIGTWTVAVAGTCSEPPPYRDLSGAWANASWGPASVTLEGVGAVDVDVALSVSAAVPRSRTPQPVSGSVCVHAPAALGLAGTYLVDRAASTWVGSDYGGARLDLVARASDGRRLAIAQAFMANAAPDALTNAILTFSGADGAAKGVIRFEDFQRTANARCP